MLSSSSSATVRVQKATSELLVGPDWTMNMDICDSVVSDHWQVKDVVKALKKRLQNKNPKVQFLVLMLLEAMIKNCGDPVHLQVVERDILQEMIKIVKKKSDVEVRDKILALLDSWQEAFGGPGGKYPQYYAAYIELKRSGVQFPQRSAESALIFTPPITHSAPIHRHPPAGHGMPSNASLRLDEAMASEVANFSISDLDGIQSVFELLSDMLRAVNQNDRESVKDEVITDLVARCRSNQQNLVQFLNSTGDEELLGQGLTLNDNLQSVLVKHDAIASGSLPPTILESSKPSSPVASALVATKRLEDDMEDDNDDFVQIARRNLKVDPASSRCTSAESGVFPVFSDTSDLTTTSTCTEASPSSANNALILLDPPVPVTTVTNKQGTIDLLSMTLSPESSAPATNKQDKIYLLSMSLSPESSAPATYKQDMIDLLSMTLSSESTAPVTLPALSNQNGHAAPVASDGHRHDYTYNPCPYTLNQEYNSYNSYVAPWARPQPQPAVPQFSSSYPPPPWEVPTTADTNPLCSTAYPYAASYYSNSVFPAPSSMSMPVYASHPHQQYNSFDARVNSGAASADEVRVNASLRQPAPAAAKPFVLPNRLFDDLIDLRIPDGRLKTSNPSQVSSKTVGQGTIGGKKENPGD